MLDKIKGLKDYLKDQPINCPQCRAKIESYLVVCVKCGTIISKKNIIFRDIFLSGIISAIISIVIYLLILIHTKIFTEHWLNAFIFYVSVWSIILLGLKYISYKRQEKALSIFKSNTILEILLRDEGIDVNNYEKKISTFAGVLKNKGYFNLLNIIIFDRIRKILNYLKCVPDKNEINNTLSYQAQIDSSSVDLEFKMISAFYWAIPILGFIGTVLGIGESINSFGSFISGSGASLADASLRNALSGVTVGLAIAFDSTLIALAFAVVIVPVGMYIENKYFDLLGQIEEYCLNFLTPNINFSRKK